MSYNRPSATSKLSTNPTTTNIPTPKITRISINSSNNVTKYTPKKEQITQQRTQIRPSDAYNFHVPKIVRVSNNVPERKVVSTRPLTTTSQYTNNRNITIGSTNNPYQRRENVKSYTGNQNVVIRSTNQTNQTTQNQIKRYQHPRNLKYSNSKILSSYGASNTVNAFSSKSGAVHYVTKKSSEVVTSQPRIIRASQNIPKNSTRYEKLHVNNSTKSNRLFPFNSSEHSLLTNSQKTNIVNNKIYKKKHTIKDEGNNTLSKSTIKFANHKWNNVSTLNNIQRVPLKKASFSKNRFINATPIVRTVNGNKQRIVISGNRRFLNKH